MNQFFKERKKLGFYIEFLILLVPKREISMANMISLPIRNKIHHEEINPFYSFQEQQTKKKWKMYRL